MLATCRRLKTFTATTWVRSFRTAESAPEPVFKNLYLLSATGDGRKPFRAIRFQNHTKADFIAALRSIRVQFVIDRDNVPESFSQPEDVDAIPSTSLRLTPLKEGGHYLPIYGTTDMEKEIQDLQGWQPAISKEDQALAGKWAVQSLETAGHTNVTRYCGPHEIRDSDGGPLFEFDAAAYAEHCAVIVKAAPTLKAGAADQLESTLASTAFFAAKGHRHLRVFDGKRLHGALFGQRITADAHSARILLARCKVRGIPVVLADCPNVSRGDSCAPLVQIPWKLAS
ncbi:hypothetical protein WJX73_008681 [Symbiochloris irregularis]|uniref:Uncharacterized protein n=1 Tax=Symbiochloris irregularis TaxID=706552 RepID=A0AAW1P4M6_9CHLO